jgi:hypothetical protein
MDYLLCAAFATAHRSHSRISATAPQIHAGRNRDAGHLLRQDQPGPKGPDGIVFTGPRKAEIHEHPVAHVLHHDASERGGGSGADIMIGVEDGAVFLGMAPPV